MAEEERNEEHEEYEEYEESNAKMDVAEDKPNDEHAEEELHNENEVEEELCYELEDGEGHGMLATRANRSGRESKAIMKKAVKKKKKFKNVGCVRVQSHNGRVSEVSCENCTHMAIVAKKKKLSMGCYTQRDSGGVRTTPESSGQGLHHGYWDSKGMHEDENTVVIQTL